MTYEGRSFHVWKIASGFKLYPNLTLTLCGDRRASSGCISLQRNHSSRKADNKSSMAPPTIPGDEPTSGMFDKVVDVIVGTGATKKTFQLHEGLLRHYSGYFDAALGGGFAEAKTRVIELKEDDVPTFERFVLWLYTGKYRRVAVASEGHYDPICKLWVLGDSRQIPLLANAMIDILEDDIVKLGKLPIDNVSYVYANTMPGSKLRAFTAWVIASMVP